MTVKYAAETATVTFGFGNNDPSDGSAADADSTPSGFVREAGATASDAPITTGVSVALLSHASYPAGSYELSVNGTTASLSADTEYEVYVSAVNGGTTSVARVGTLITSPLMDAAGVRDAVGLASANLDTQLGDVPTVSEFNARTILAPDYAREATSTGISDSLAEYEDGTTKIQVDLREIGGVEQSATDLKDFADAGYDPATNKVQGVVLVDTTTTNTDMTTSVAAIQAKTDQLTFTTSGNVDANLKKVAGGPDLQDAGTGGQLIGE